MHSIGTLVRRMENLVSFSALALLVFSVLWGVSTRYIFESPAIWTTELSGILFTWVVYIGAMTAFRDGKHIRVTLFVDIMPTPVRRALIKFGDICVLGFLLYLTYLSVLMMQKGATRPSPVLDIPFSMVYLATVICFAGMSVTSALRIFGVLSDPQVDPAEDVL